MQRLQHALLVSQAGKLEPVLVTAGMVGLLALLIGRYTGTRVLLFTFASGLIRLTIGLCSALVPAVWWGCHLHTTVSLGGFGTTMVVYALLTCMVLAGVLIPVGLIQTVGTVIQRLYDTTRR
jgi:hypothetical protein